MSSNTAKFANADLDSSMQVAHGYPYNAREQKHGDFGPSNSLRKIMLLIHFGISPALCLCLPSLIIIHLGTARAGPGERAGISQEELLHRWLHNGRPQILITSAPKSQSDTDCRVRFDAKGRTSEVGAGLAGGTTLTELSAFSSGDDEEFNLSRTMVAGVDKITLEFWQRSQTYWSSLTNYSSQVTDSVDIKGGP